MTIWYSLCANVRILYSVCRIYVILCKSLFLELMNQIHHSYLLIKMLSFALIKESVAAFNIKIPIKQLMNRNEGDSKEARQIILCRMPKYNEMHLFKHVLLKYIRKVFLVYCAIKIVTTCLYSEITMMVYKILKF